MLRKRVVTALCGIPVLIVAIWFDGPWPWFTILAAIWGLLAVLEFYKMVGAVKFIPLTCFGMVWALLFILHPHYDYELTVPLLLTSGIALSLILLLFSLQKEGPVTNWAWIMVGILYVGWLLSYLVALRLDAGRDWLYLALFATFGSDTAAYFLGKAFGKHKLAPLISPGKTWEGAIAGLFGAVIISLLFTLDTPLQLPLSYSVNSPMKKLQYGAQKLGLHLTTEQLEQFEIYYQELVDWNERMNLTSITDYEEVQVKHFLDSLTVMMAIKPVAKGQRQKVIDVGTGAGLPGIPLKVLWPDIKLVLLEATTKKTKFLQHIVDRLGLDNVEIAVGRAEEAAHNTRYRGNFDLVVSRAVASLPALVEITLPFCAVGGRFISQKKGDIEREVEQSQKAIDIMGGSLREVKSIELAELHDKRYLVVIDKTGPTPAEYPRRPGIPAKRPIVS